MQNPIWNLMIRVCSLAGGVLLLIGIGLLAAFRFGFVEDSFAGILTVFLGAGLSLYALVAVNMAHFRLRREIAEAADIAHRLSAGETYDGPAETELLDSLRNVSLYFEEK